MPVVVTEGRSCVAPLRANAVIPAPSAVIELVHPSGIVMRVPAGSEAAALRTVLGVLDERSTVSADRQAEARRC